MANFLNELDVRNQEQVGNDVNVIQKQKEAIKPASVWFLEIFLLLTIIGIIIYFLYRVKAHQRFQQLEQQINSNASTIDNYLEQRVRILSNAVGIVEKAIELDKDVMKTVAALRAGNRFTNLNNTESQRNLIASQLDSIARSINVSFEAYPDLKAHAALADAMQQNAYLQKEITAARELYNDTINQWNKEIFEWPVKIAEAAKQRYTTRIPFAVSSQVKQEAKQVFFK